MRSLKKLTLATVIASAPFSTQALESLDDDFLSDVTGQEGITIETQNFQTIEEFQYVDGDGDGSGTAGKVVASDIAIGEFSGFSLGVMQATAGTAMVLDYNAANLTATHTKTSIDAAANGVLITTEEVGDASPGAIVNTIASPVNSQLPLTDGTGKIQFNATQGRIATLADAAAGTDLIVDFADASGNTLDLHGKANGQDMHIGSIQLGNANNTLASIGSVTMLNSGNWGSSGQALTILGKTGIHSTNPGLLTAAIFQNSNRYIASQTLISSKTSGTGIHIVSEGGVEAEAIYYEDTDGAGGNQVGVIAIAQFRLADTDDINSVDRELDSGTYIRGARSEFDLDVENGKLVLSNQVSDSSTYIDKFFIGDVNEAMTTGAGVVGSIAILGSHTEGTTSIYAH